jgi:aldose 1-epimerase
MTLPKEDFGLLGDGRVTTLYTLENAHLRVRITDYGGRLVSVEAPDRAGLRDHVVLGFDDAASYARAGGSFGTLLGRYANRIDRAGFDLDGIHYPLAATHGAVVTHGGPAAFSTKVWDVTDAIGGAAPELCLRHVSPDGDQGFPGTLTATARYRLEGATLTLTLAAETTAPTVVNLSAHPYFNLAGPASRDVLDHEVTIPAAAFLPTDPRQVPTGEIRPVDGTPFDFRTPTSFAARICQPDPQLLLAAGYDHCFVLGMAPATTPALAVRLREPRFGRVLEVLTDQPGVQVYTGNKLTGMVVGRGMVAYRQSAGVAIEPQDFPDAPHQPGFPSTILRPGESYRRRIAYRFSAED